MGTVLCCDVCRTPLSLSDFLSVAINEVTEFVQLHSEHETWAMAIRNDATCPCQNA